MMRAAAEIIAHRGASFDAPENTLAAIQLAWKQGADAAEIDVHCSKDGHIVVIHDDNTRKTAGFRKKVAAQTLAELKQLDAGSWKHSKFKGEPIPTLAEVLAKIPRGKRLFVEIKCGPECIPGFVKDFRASELEPDRVVPIGFSLETMSQLKRTLPDLEVCWIVEFKRGLGGWSPTVGALTEQVMKAGLDGIDVSGRGPVNADFMRQMRKAGQRLYIWTVDDPARAKELIEAGVDGITTNKPGWLRSQL